MRKIELARQVYVAVAVFVSLAWFMWWIAAATLTGRGELALLAVIGSAAILATRSFAQTDHEFWGDR